MKQKKLILLVIILINLLIDIGCWNYKEINEKVIVGGVAVDYDEENEKTLLTVEVIKPTLKGEKTEINSEILQMEGDNTFDAVRDFISISGRKLFWSHAKVVVFSENIVKEEDKFISVLDFLSRDAETRDDLWLLLAKDMKASNVWKSELKVEDIVSFHLDDMMRNEKSFSKFHGVHLYDFIDNLSYKGVSPTLPTIDLESYEEKTISRVYGTSVFKGSKNIGWLNGEQTKFFLMVIDELKGGTLVIEEKVGSETIPISLEIFDNKTKVKPIYEDGNLTMKIDIKTTVNINEIGTETDFINDKGLKKLKKDGEKLIEEEVKNVIKFVQSEYGSDIFGFGGIIERELPKLWKEIGSNWQNEFKNINIEVKSDLNIRGSALRSKTIKLGE